MNKNKMKSRLFYGLLTTVVLSGVVLPSLGQISVFSVDVSTNQEETPSVTPVPTEATADDGMFDAWTLDSSTSAGGEVNALEDTGYLHLSGGPSSGNTSGSVFVDNTATLNFAQAGFFETTFRNNGAASWGNFGFALGYVSSGKKVDGLGMFIGCSGSTFYWQTYDGSKNNYGNFSASSPAMGQSKKLRIDWDAAGVVTVTIDGVVQGTTLKFSDVAADFTTTRNKIGIKCAGSGTAIWDVSLRNMHYTGQQNATAFNVTGKVIDESAQPVQNATVKIGNVSVLTAVDGTFTVPGVVRGGYTLVVDKRGYNVFTKEILLNTTSDMSLGNLTLTSPAPFDTDTIESSSMRVTVQKTFPSVVNYFMKGDGTTFAAQEKDLHTITLNGIDIVLNDSDVSMTVANDKKSATYTLHAVNTDNQIDAMIKAKLSVEGNILTFDVLEIENALNTQAGYEKYPIQKIQFKNQYLAAITTDSANPQYKGATFTNNTTQMGDTTVELSQETTSLPRADCLYGFVSTGTYSAGVWSNSESPQATGSNDKDNTRIFATLDSLDGERKSIGLASAAWYYHRKVTDTHGNTSVVKELEMPQAKVIITGEQNDDGIVDWQDGAIAYRSIMQNPYKSEEVPELVGQRIVMNFGSQAQNPFLTTLDNVKRVSLSLDGLGQMILLKGYNNEGHDSAHPDFADIGQRIGGEADMNYLLQEAKKYSVKSGVHLNTIGAFVQAKAFSWDLLNLGSNNTPQYGGDWTDTPFGIDGVVDLVSGARKSRLKELYDKVGDGLDFLYYDVWGNGTSAIPGVAEDPWLGRRVIDDTNSLGYRMVNEWCTVFEYGSTFNHWATDLTYGGYTQKGENSEVLRFLRNHQKDTWVADYNKYEGAANFPLLGGYSMKDFEGWQGRNDYDAWVENVYTVDLATKFLQHYKVVKWEDGTTQTYDGVNAKSWTPEMKITLKDDAGNTVVVSRDSNDIANAGYRSRTITLNGQVILKGGLKGVSAVSGTSQGADTQSYLLPWNWNPDTGEAVAAEDEKLFHYSLAGGTSTWDLPESWSDLANVKVYQLTDLGKTNEQTIAVQDGKITLTATAKTPYVVTKGAKANQNITWSEGMHLVDTSFNSGKENIATLWNKTGDGTWDIVKSKVTNPMLKMTGAVDMTQTITDLQKGKQYAVLVGVDNRSDSKAGISIESDGKTVVTNYTTKSIAKNYVQADAHNTNSSTVDGTSYFQNMYVYFTATSDKATLHLTRAAGAGDTYFDNIRVVQNDSAAPIYNSKGDSMIAFTTDFETTVQGVYPFVIGGAEGVEDNHTHLSERNGEYTQAGWYQKEMDEVLDDTWSLMVHGMEQRQKLVIQTVPQNIRFEAGEKYKVAFDYKAGTTGIYQFVVGNGEYAGSGDANFVQKTDLEQSLGSGDAKRASYTVTGDDSGQTWIGIYSTNVADSTESSWSDGRKSFSGRQDVILDNLDIQKIANNTEITALRELIASYREDVYTKGSWANFKPTLDAANKIVNTKADGPTSVEVMKASDELKEAAKSLTLKDQDKTKILFNKDSDGLKKLTVPKGSDKKATWSLKLHEPVLLNERGDKVLDAKGNVDTSVFYAILKDANGKQIGGVLNNQSTVQLGAGKYSVTLYDYNPATTQKILRFLGLAASTPYKEVDTGAISFTVAEVDENGNTSLPETGESDGDLPSTNEVKTTAFTLLGAILLAGVALVFVEKKRKA